MNITRFFLRILVGVCWATIFMGALYIGQITFPFAQDRVITVAAWSDIFDPALLEEFQQQTGIKVHVSSFSSNEELLVKMKKTDGKAFDLVIPSDYAVKILREQQLLKKIDHTQLSFFDDLNPLLLNHPFDPANEYSVPLFWELYGVGVNPELFSEEQMREPWQLIFKDQGHSITMVNDPVEMVMLAGLYLYGNIDALDSEQLAAVENLLRAQKKYVRAYVDFRGDYFLVTKNCAAMVSSSSYVFRAQKQFPFIRFLVPEKTFVTIENCAISASTLQEKAIYQLLNYLYKPEHVAHHSEQFSFFPPTISGMHMIRGSEQYQQLAALTPELFSKLLFFKRQLAPLDLLRVWARVKS